MTSVRHESRSHSLTVLSLSKAFYFTRSLKQAMTPAFISEMITPVARQSMAGGTNHQCHIAVTGDGSNKGDASLA